MCMAVAKRSVLFAAAQRPTPITADFQPSLSIMNPNLKWKALFILVVILLCIYGLIGLPTFPTSMATIKDNFSKQIKLGLDLQGGTHLVLQVQVQEAVAQETDQLVDAITKQLRDRNIRYDEIRRVDDTHILVRNVETAQSSAFRDFVQQQYGTSWQTAPAAGEPNGYSLTLLPSAIATIQTATMTQSVETISQRINALGLTEPTIQLRGRNDNEIVVQLPGEGDPARAKAVIQAGGQLELRLVEDPRPYTSQVEGISAHSGVLPAGTVLLPGNNDARNSASSAPSGEVWYLVSRAPVVTGRDLQPSGIQVNRQVNNPGSWQVDFVLTQDAARRFGPFTEANIGKQLAIVLDGRVTQAPTINGKIEDRGLIEGNYTQQSAQDLALELRSGALPASIKYLEERTVGPSLGAASIRHGVQASVLSLIAVRLFMLFYYRLSGANSGVPVSRNLIFCVALSA